MEEAFKALEQNEYVIGPAQDGGYYLLGMNKFNIAVFKNKDWGTETVYQNTMEDLKNNRVSLLERRNDIDLYEDIKYIKVFQPFLKNI